MTNCGGRIGPYLENDEPDLANLGVFFEYVEPGDMIFVVSDGVADNFGIFFIFFFIFQIPIFLAKNLLKLVLKFLLKKTLGLKLIKKKDQFYSNLRLHTRLNLLEI